VDSFLQKDKAKSDRQIQIR